MSEGLYINVYDKEFGSGKLKYHSLHEFLNLFNHIDSIDNFEPFRVVPDLPNSVQNFWELSISPDRGDTLITGDVVTFRCESYFAFTGLVANIRYLFRDTKYLIDFKFKFPLDDFDNNDYYKYHICDRGISKKKFVQILKDEYVVGIWDGEDGIAFCNGGDSL